MGAHLIDGEFQSDKYPTTPRGKVPLSVKDPRVQDLLYEMARRWQSVDDELAADLMAALRNKGFVPPSAPGRIADVEQALRDLEDDDALQCDSLEPGNGPCGVCARCRASALVRSARL